MIQGVHAIARALSEFAPDKLAWPHSDVGHVGLHQPRYEKKRR